MLYELDLRLFELINRGFTAKGLDWLAVALQDPWWLWVPLGAFAAYLLVKGGRQGRWFVLAAVVAVVLTDVFCAQVLKPLIGRPRPTIALEGVRMLLGRKSGFSMPSNHAANIAAAALLFSIRYRRLAPVFVIVALAVGWSRVYAGVHYPLDVLLGYAIGAVFAALTMMAKDSLAKRFETRSPNNVATGRQNN
ncbi:MAG: phosphatase PAP2 family protein [Candidatus Lernaella stagnicola]|nr:phosphatase PAP2 family protein [Candidatus Lernaella stagnicola]